MSGPARFGALIYAKDLARLSDFYRLVLDMRLLKGNEDLHVLASADAQLLIHAIPEHIASTFTISTPPVPREDVALKLFFSVPNMRDAIATISRLGGSVWPEEWRGPGFNVRNAVDPEGNIFQIREFV
ncbi:MAG: VOC family protein [Lysobacterales bacterium]